MPEQARPSFEGLGDPKELNMEERGEQPGDEAKPLIDKAGIEEIKIESSGDDLVTEDGEE